MHLMVDVVPNYMASHDPVGSINSAILNPFNNKQYFHDVCWIKNYNNQTEAEQRWLGNNDYSLPDLDPSRTDV
jgi:alpha-amylase